MQPSQGRGNDFVLGQVGGGKVFVDTDSDRPNVNFRGGQAYPSH